MNGPFVTRVMSEVETTPLTNRSTASSVAESLVGMATSNFLSSTGASYALENSPLQRRTTSSSSLSGVRFSSPLLTSVSDVLSTSTSLSWIATAAFGFLLVQWMSGGSSSRKNDGVSSDEDDTGSRWWITRILLRTLGFRKASKGSDHVEQVVLHRGSCQCGSITFKLTPPRSVKLLQNYAHLGKLQYPTARVPADQLQLTSGKNLWNTYHVQSDDGDIWAFSFCKSCATQLLHATEADQTSLFVNVQCFHEIERTKTSRSNATKKNKDAKKAKQQGRQDEDSVDTKNSALTTVTALPNFADPRLFAQSRQSSSMLSSGDDASDEAPRAPPSHRTARRQQYRQASNPRYAAHQPRGNPSWQQHQPNLITYVEGDADSVEPMLVEGPPSISSSRKSGGRSKKSAVSSSSSSSWNRPQRDLVTYSRRVDAYAKFSTRLSGSNSPPAQQQKRHQHQHSAQISYGQQPIAPMVEWPPPEHHQHSSQNSYGQQPIAPMVEWPPTAPHNQDSVHDMDEDEDDDVVHQHPMVHPDDDDEESLSSHSGSKTYSVTAATVASSTASIDYNISASRENMLNNMRKHLAK